MLRWVTSRDCLFFLAMGLGLAAGGLAPWGRPAVIPILAAVMTLSTLSVSGDLFRPPKAVIGPLLTGSLLCYVILGGLFALAGLLFRSNPPLRLGFAILAAAPPAVAVIPFADWFDADRAFTFLAAVGVYLGALALTPLMLLILVGPSAATPGQVLGVLIQLVLLPLVTSRILRRLGLAPRLERIRGVLVNAAFFMVLYIIFGLNRDLLLREPQGLLPLLAVGGASMFGLALVFRSAGRRLGVPTPRLTSCILLGTLKNYGLAAGLSLTLFGKESALPAIVVGALLFPYASWLGWILRRAQKAEARRPGTG